LKRRARAGKWRLLLAVWTLVLAGLLLLLRLALPTPAPKGIAVVGDNFQTFYGPRGTPMFGGLALVVLALSLLVVPALTCQSVNGDRELGTLATVQVTSLTAGDITLGKFFGAWVASLAFLVATAPLVVWCMLEGGVPAINVLVTGLVLAGIMGTVSAISLALSALLVRPTTSSVFAYLSVAALCVGTLIIFGLVTAAFGTTKVTHTASIPITGPDGTTTSQTYTTDETRTDRTWWLLSPNPFVVLADAAPASSSRTISGPDGAEVSYQRLDPLGGLGHTVRRLRLAPQDQDTIGLNASDSGDDNSLGGPVWPTGLIVNVSLGILALAVTRLRLVTPTRKLPRGVRIA
jgi:ABC-type transport system involved in multi-copper enzyme maturation permease subunit